MCKGLVWPHRTSNLILKLYLSASKPVTRKTEGIPLNYSKKQYFEWLEEMSYSYSASAIDKGRR